MLLRPVKSTAPEIEPDIAKPAGIINISDIIRGVKKIIGTVQKGIALYRY